MSKNADSPHITVRALRTQQSSGVDVYAFFCPGVDILRIAELSRIERDDDDTLKGFQRREIRSHVNNIVEFLDQGAVLFPNAIILALAPEVEFKQSRGPAPAGLIEASQAGTLTIPVREEGQRAAWVVDGQQRSLALSKSSKNDIPVPVIAFVSDDLQLQREQFILVNKAKPLPIRLIDELLPETGVLLPRDLAVRKIPSELCNYLNRDPKSPFHNLIKRLSDADNKEAVITDSALVKVIKNSIGNPLGALSPFKGTKTEGAELEPMYATMCVFWAAVRDVFPDAWGLPPSKSRLMHSAGIEAMGMLMDRIMARVVGTENPQAAIREALTRIAPRCCWTSGTWEGLGLEWNEVQTVPRHIRGLADALVRLDFEASLRPQ